MIDLAASASFAGSVFLAALRLLVRRDKVHRRSYVLITHTFWIYLFIHGIGAVVPFLVYWLWPRNWSPLFTASPWLVALVTPFVVNRMLKLNGLDFPDATGPLSRFGDEVQRDFGHRMIDEQFAAMSALIAPHAKGVTRTEAHSVASRHIPMQLPEKQADAFRKAIDGAASTEEIMELYIRHIGINSFRFFFKMKPDEEVAQLLLFPEGDEREHARASRTSL